jgi:hypothetical protein
LTASVFVGQQIVNRTNAFSVRIAAIALTITAMALVFSTPFMDVDAGTVVVIDLRPITSEVRRSPWNDMPQAYRRGSWRR